MIILLLRCLVAHSDILPSLHCNNNNCWVCSHIHTYIYIYIYAYAYTYSYTLYTDITITLITRHRFVIVFISIGKFICYVSREDVVLALSEDCIVSIFGHCIERLIDSKLKYTSDGMYVCSYIHIHVLTFVCIFIYI